MANSVERLGGAVVLRQNLLDFLDDTRSPSTSSRSEEE